MSRRTFNDQGYPCAPVDLSKDCWFYAQREGFIVVTRRGICVAHEIIPWRRVRKALADHDKAKDRRRAALAKGDE